MFIKKSDHRRMRLEPLVEEGQPLQDRGALTERRRLVLFPDTATKTRDIWCPPPTTSCGLSLEQKQNASVAIVVTHPPIPTSYEPLSRYSAEIISILVNNGVNPTLLDLGSAKQSRLTRAYTKAFWPQGEIVYERVGPPDVPPVPGDIATSVTLAYTLYEWLKNSNFDVIHSLDFQGVPYFCLRAKEQGLAFSNTRIVVHPANGILQNCLEEYKGVYAIKQLPQLYVERLSLEIADTVSLPGRDTLRKLLDAGIELKREAIEHHPLRSRHSQHQLSEFVSDNRQVPIQHILCLPGASRRGISLFCKTLDRCKSFVASNFSVTFAVPIDCWHEHTRYIKSLTDNKKYSPAVETADDRTSLIHLLQNQPNTLCVFPVVDKWNYFQIKDLADLGVTILVANRSAADELLTNELNENITCSPLPDAMAKKITTLLDGNPQPRQPEREIPLPASWVTAPETLPVNEDSNSHPLVTVCLMHFERPHLVEQALSSIKKQTYPNYEVVMVDDGSLKDETLHKLEILEAQFKKNGWRIVRQQNCYLGAARNSAAMVARGKFLYFLDDDNILKPHALKTLVKVAEHMDADIVASFSDIFKGNNPPDPLSSESNRIMHIGDDLSYGFFHNAFGDSNALVRRSTFLALGGNSEDYAVGLDDMEFFSRAILNGYRLTVVPEALYWARQLPDRLRNLHFNPGAGNIRVCRTYLPHVPTKLRPLLLLVSGRMEMVFEGKDITLRSYFTSIKIRLANTGFGSWLRTGFLGSVIHRILVFLNLNDS